MLHANYTKILPRLVPEGVSFQAARKLAFDQTVFAGTLTCGFYLSLNTVEGKGLNTGIEEIKKKFIPTIIINWKFWIPASFINFSLTPVKYQVLFANIVQLFYNIALSWIHNED